MISISENRRHRIHGDELEPVLRAVKAHLSQLLEDRRDFHEAEALFKVLWRFKENKHGRPSYPPTTWELIENWVKGPFIQIDQPTEAMLEKWNFRNLCLFYRDELKRILSGEPASEVLNPGERSTLKRRGLLTLTRKGPRGGASYGITVKALAILESSS